MCEITIPPSPGWYLSNIAGCNDDGSVVAYGAKHELVILRVDAAHNVQSSFIPMAHKDRIVAVSFSSSASESFPHHFVSCSDDGSVQVWDHTTETLILSHLGHGEGHKVVCVDWSRADVNLVVSVSDRGSLVCWDVISNTIRRLFVGPKTNPTCLSCCPHNKDVVAIGAKSGLTLIFNLKGDGSTTFRLRGHETDVVSLSWCPVSSNIFKEGDTEKTCLLASGAKDRSIYFWRAGTDGRHESFINLPQQAIATSGYRSKTGVGGVGSNWIAVRWVKERVLLASSLYGELLAFDLGHSSAAKLKPPRLLHGTHNKGLFAIVAPHSSAVTTQLSIVWTYALDRRLVACTIDSGKIVADLTTIGGIVYCLSSSPLDPCRVAIGTGDNKILVWNTSNDNCDNISTIWNKISSKVMALAWHPVNESLLAFGTGEGRVGLVDVSKPTSVPKLFRQHHRRSVYSLIWAPPVVEQLNQFALFSVGDGDILQHSPDAPEKEPINLSGYFKQCDASAKVSKALGRTDLAWNHNCSLAAVGNDNGVLYIVDGRTFSHVHTIFAHKKLVQCVAWHPASVTSEDTLSPLVSWLASASDNIQVINVTAGGVEVVASLNTHSEKVVSLVWSPHFNGRLISASYDYTSQVWDVPSGTVLACFDGHHGSVVCCSSSALHQDWIMTGSADNTVRVWNTNNFRLTKTKTKKQRLSGVLKKFAGARSATNLNLVQTVDDHATSVRMHFKHGESETKRKQKSMFPVTSGGISEAKHLSLLWSQTSGSIAPKRPSTANSGYLDFFGDGQCMRRLAVVEELHHRDHGNAYQADSISLWAGDLAESLKTACRKKQLNEWLVSLAPMVSHKLWSDCCRCYAAQLAESGDPMKAASYLLSIHLVEEAIELLLEGKLYREAVCLAKLRLPRNDVTIKKAVTEWANHVLETGMLSLAAHCMLSIGANIEAVEILSKSKDPEHLALGANIATKAKASEMGLSLAMRAITAGLELQKYSIVRETVSAHTTLDDLTLWIDVCELKSTWQPKNDEVVLAWICGRVADANKWVGLYEKALEVCQQKITSYTVLSKFQPNKPTTETEQTVWIYIASQISLAAAAQLQPNNTRCVLRHLIRAMEAGYCYHLHNPSNLQFYLQLCVWISPWGPLGTLSKIETSEKTLVESFCAYLACGVVYWLDALVNKGFSQKDLADVYPVLIRCSSLLFHKEVVARHKIDLEIKKLENSVAANKLRAFKAMKMCKDIEAKLQNSANPGGETLVDEATVEIEADVKRLGRLKSVRAAFEEDRVDAPNPFITFCTLRNVLESIADKRPDAQIPLQQIVELWTHSSATDDAADRTAQTV